MHTLRHSFAIQLLDRKIDICLIQVLLGHRKLDSPAICTRAALKTIRDVESPLALLAPPPPPSRRRATLMTRPPLEVADIPNELGDAYWRADTLLTIAADPKHLGARVGLTTARHTWGSAMTHHPHIHIVVPGDGLAPDSSRWIACRPGFFLPVRVLSQLFIDRLAEARRATQVLHAKANRRHILGSLERGQGLGID